MQYYFGPKKKMNYFEGWYFKQTSQDLNIAFIPSISVVNKIDKKAFIQVISNMFTERFAFSYDEFSSQKNILSVKISNNTFSAEGLKLYLKNEHYEIIVNLIYSPFLQLKHDIMGPFKHLPKMECKHNIFSMKHLVNGQITINDKEYRFNDDFGYLEGDYGSSFPSKYIWMQANNLQNGAFFLSIATIPYGKINFSGLIGSLYVGNKEYRFATYNFSKLVKNTNDHITIKKGRLLLDVYLKDSHRLLLSAPKNGDMTRKVFESMDATIEIVLSKNKKEIYHGTASNASIEIG
ncbi:MAG: tocopherol cyclase family protein [Bacilli bacterium]